MTVPILSTPSALKNRSQSFLWQGDVENFLYLLPSDPVFDLVITSPPYNLNKEYENKLDLSDYIKQQSKIIRRVAELTKPNGSICWQVGNYIQKGKNVITPLDIILHPLFEENNLKLRNRIVWHFGHGLHSKKRFSGRYEVILWYTKTDNYKFHLDDVRVPSKYPGKRYYKGPKKGEYSSHPMGKNPEDVWDIPNVKSNHVEKTAHPCQFPVGLVERLILALSNQNDLIFDPFAGVGSTGVAAALHGRRFWGCDIKRNYLRIAKARIDEALGGMARYRPHDKPIYDHHKSPLSKKPSK